MTDFDSVNSENRIRVIPLSLDQLQSHIQGLKPVTVRDKTVQAAAFFLKPQSEPVNASPSDFPSRITVSKSPQSSADVKPEKAPPPLPPRPPVLKKHPNEGRPLPQIPTKQPPPPLPPRNVPEKESIRTNIFVRVASTIREISIKTFLAIRDFFENVFAFLGKVTHIRIGNTEIHFPEEKSEQEELETEIKPDEVVTSDDKIETEEEVLMIEIPDGEFKEGVKTAQKVVNEALKVLDVVLGDDLNTDPSEGVAVAFNIPVPPPLPSLNQKRNAYRKEPSKVDQDGKPETTREENHIRRGSPPKNDTFNLLREGLGARRKRMIDEDDDDDAFFSISFKGENNARTEVSVGANADSLKVRRAEPVNYSKLSKKQEVKATGKRISDEGLLNAKNALKPMEKPVNQKVEDAPANGLQAVFQRAFDARAPQG